jgi:hypothetical protein
MDSSKTVTASLYLRTEYTYDYAGQRISSWLPTNNTGVGGRIYCDGQQLGFRSSDGMTYFDHQDTLGTERMRTDFGAGAGSSYASLPWGDGYAATIDLAGADQDNEHFAGMEQDENTSNVPMSEHAQFRQYSFLQGRWLAPDPGVNRDGHLVSEATPVEREFTLYGLGALTRT